MFMQQLLTAVALVSLFSSTAAAEAERPGTKGRDSAQLVVRNAVIYTVDAARSWAQALAVEDGRIVVVGDDADVLPWIGPATKVVDAGGRLLLPGFHDPHVHLALSASRRQYCDLGYPKSLPLLRDSIADCVKKTNGWVLMSNPNTTVFPTDRSVRDFLDTFAHERPMVINGLHSSFANSAALAHAGITATTANPPHGAILREPDGTPNGTLRETAQDLLYKHVPALSPEQVEAAFRELLAQLPAHGIVSVQELSGSNRSALYARALAEGWLTVRLRHAQMLLGGADVPRPESGTRTFSEIAGRFRTRWLNAGAVKIFVDGDLGDRTAALFEPYAGRNPKRERGEPIWTQEELDVWAKKLDAAGLQLHFHAMGDRAVHMALNAVEHAQNANGRRDARHQITHLHLIADDDVPRFRKLRVVANVQPYFAENIAYNTVLALELLGARRHSAMFRFRDLLAGGAMLAASSDGPVASPLNPFVSIQAALTRQEPGSAEPPFLPDQRLTLPEVLAAYTIGGAYANFLDAESGSLQVGKWADFVLLDRNLFDMPPEKIRDTRILWTVMEGREVFRSNRW